MITNKFYILKNRMLIGINHRKLYIMIVPDITITVFGTILTCIKSALSFEDVYIIAEQSIIA